MSASMGLDNRRETLAAVGRCGAANAAHRGPELLVEGGTSDAGRQGAAGACAPSRATIGAAGAALLLTLAIVPRFPAGSPRSTPPIVPDGHIQVRLAYGEDGGGHDATAASPKRNAHAAAHLTLAKPRTTKNARTGLSSAGASPKIKSCQKTRKYVVPRRGLPFRRINFSYINALSSLV